MNPSRQFRTRRAIALIGVLCGAIVAMLAVVAPPPTAAGPLWTADSATYRPLTARGQRPSSSPTVSPYLNLLRRDAGPITNYFTLVRPQLQTQAIEREQQREIDALRYRVSQPAGTSTTGQAPQRAPGQPWFMNYQGHYPQPRQPSRR